MERSWVYAIAAGAALFVVVIGIRHFGSSESDESPTPQARVAALPDRGRGESGWIARPGSNDSGSGGTEANARTQPFGGRASGSAGSAGVPGSGGPGAGASERRGGASVFVDRGRGRTGGTGSGTITTRDSGDGSIQVGSNVPAAEIPFEGARPLSGGPVGGRPGQGPVRETVVDPAAADPNKPPPPEDGGPVLSLPFDKSAEPDRGDSAVFDQGITFDSGDGARFSTDSQFVVPNGGNLNGEAGAISTWVQPDWAGGDESNASLVQLRNQNQWEDRLQIFKNGRYMRFLLTDSAGQESNIGATIDDWAPGDWHHLAATWERNADGHLVQSFYVDGRMIGQVPVQGQFNVRPGTPLYIGSDLPLGVPGANGVISQFQAYNRALTPSEIAGQAANRR